MDFGLRTSDYGLQTLGYRLWTMDFGLRTLDFGLWTLDIGLWTSTMEHQAVGTPCFVVLLEYRSDHYKSGHGGCMPQHDGSTNTSGNNRRHHGFHCKKKFSGPFFASSRSGPAAATVLSSLLLHGFSKTFAGSPKNSPLSDDFIKKLYNNG